MNIKINIDIYAKEYDSLKDGAKERTLTFNEKEVRQLWDSLPINSEIARKVHKFFTETM